MKALDFIERFKFSLIGVFTTYAVITIWANWFVVETYIPPVLPNEEVIAILDYSKEEKIDPENTTDPNQSTELSENQPATNVAANVTQEKTTYTNQFSKAQTDQQVWEELKAMEAAEFSSLGKDNPNLIDKSAVVDKEVNPNLVKKDAEKNDKAGYGMDVVATVYYKLEGRNVLSEKKPSYLCKSEGTVRVTIKVNQKGQVVVAEIDESHTNTGNTCLRDAALEYAKLWKFNQDFADEIRKQGWIEFKYQAQ
ncbi:MAG: TonB family protein [Flavobacteriales bacterium]|nr:TonB family protein [Flavobacteriales bacterium]MCB9197983.1 TonB family protein [Flavobacteriales bacterium]